MSARDVLLRAGLRYHAQPERSLSCGSMDIDMELMVRGFVEIGEDIRLHVTDAGRAFLAKHGGTA